MSAPLALTAAAPPAAIRASPAAPAASFLLVMGSFLRQAAALRRESARDYRQTPGDKGRKFLPFWRVATGMRTPIATLVAALSLAVIPIADANQTWPDAVSSDNVDYLGSIKEDVGLTTGAKVVGNRLFVTSAKNISIYDISTPETPVRIGIIRTRRGRTRRCRPTARSSRLRAISSRSMPNCVNSSSSGTAGSRLHPVLRRARPVEHPARSASRRRRTTRPSACSTARGSTAGRARSSMRATPSTAREPRLRAKSATGSRTSGRTRASTPRAATTSARSGPACCSPPAGRSR